jgi:hypothetical protein
MTRDVEISQGQPSRSRLDLRRVRRQGGPGALSSCPRANPVASNPAQAGDPQGAAAGLGPVNPGVTIARELRAPRIGTVARRCPLSRKPEPDLPYWLTAAELGVDLIPSLPKESIGVELGGASIRVHLVAGDPSPPARASREQHGLSSPSVSSGPLRRHSFRVEGIPPGSTRPPRQVMRRKRHRSCDVMGSSLKAMPWFSTL